MESMGRNPEKIAECIRKAGSIAIASHVNPDGDTLGSAAAMYLALKSAGKEVSLFCDGKVPEGTEPHRFRYLVSLFNHSYWVLGSVLGSLLGSVLPFSTEGIEFSMTALFIASFVEQWLSARQHLPALAGLLGTLACLLVFGPERFLIPAMLLITLVLTLFQGRLSAGKEAEA